LLYKQTGNKKYKNNGDQEDLGVMEHIEREMRKRRRKESNLLEPLGPKKEGESGETGISRKLFAFLFLCEKSPAYDILLLLL
jgi:hypothetical protein